MKLEAARRAVELADQLEQLRQVRTMLVGHPSWKIVIGAQDNNDTTHAAVEFEADIGTVDKIIEPIKAGLTAELKALGIKDE